MSSTRPPRPSREHRAVRLECPKRPRQATAEEMAEIIRAGGPASVEKPKLTFDSDAEEWTWTWTVATFSSRDKADGEAIGWRNTLVKRCGFTVDELATHTWDIKNEDSLSPENQRIWFFNVELR